MDYINAYFCMVSKMSWFQFILDNPYKQWEYDCLSSNPNITWDIVKANPDKPWNYQGLSLNPNITWDIVKANPNKDWDYCYLSQNKMSKYEFPKSIMKRRAKERTSIIKEELVSKSWHPDRVQKWLDAGMDIDDC